MTGSLSQVRAGAPGAPPMLRAELADGRDAITVIWLGRNQITGIEPGRALSVEGTLALRRGRPVIYNPRYELGPRPRDGGTGPQATGGFRAVGSGGLPPGRRGVPPGQHRPRPGGSVPG
jgi:hypothetical protein